MTLWYIPQDKKFSSIFTNKIITREGPKSPTQYRRILQYRRLFMSDVIFKRLNFLNAFFLIYVYLRLVEHLIWHIVVINFIWNACLTPYKIKKLFKLWRHFERLRFFQTFNKNLFLAPYRRQCQYRRFFPEKITAILGFPLYSFISLGKIFRWKILEKLGQIFENFWISDYFGPCINASWSKSLSSLNSSDCWETFFRRFMDKIL